MTDQSNFAAVLNLRSTFSDGKFSVPQLVDIYGSQGVGAIAITDPLLGPHTVQGRLAAAFRRALRPSVLPLYREILRSETRRAWDRYGMILIPGIEVSLKGAGIFGSRGLVLGLDDPAEALAHLHELASWVEKFKGVLARPQAGTGRWKVFLSAERNRDSILNAIREERFWNSIRGAEDNHEFNLGNGSRRTGNSRYSAPPRRHPSLSPALSQQGAEISATGPAARSLHFETPQRR